MAAEVETAAGGARGAPSGLQPAMADRQPISACGPENHEPSLSDRAEDVATRSTHMVEGSEREFFYDRKGLWAQHDRVAAPAKTGRPRTCKLNRASETIVGVLLDVSGGLPGCPRLRRAPTASHTRRSESATSCHMGRWRMKYVLTSSLCG